jgi:hypothetical protein
MAREREGAPGSPWREVAVPDAREKLTYEFEAASISPTEALARASTPIRERLLVPRYTVDLCDLLLDCASAPPDQLGEFYEPFTRFPEDVIASMLDVRPVRLSAELDGPGALLEPWALWLFRLEDDAYVYLETPYELGDPFPVLARIRPFDDRATLADALVRAQRFVEPYIAASSRTTIEAAVGGDVDELTMLWRKFAEHISSPDNPFWDERLQTPRAVDRCVDDMIRRAREHDVPVNHVWPD